MHPDRNELQQRSTTWVHSVIALLDAAIGQLHNGEAIHATLVEATSLLRRQVAPECVRADSSGGERLLAWQVQRVINHIDRCIAGRVLVGELCTVAQRSESHFSRAFRGTFGHPPHAFVVRRRVELAARYMLQTDAPLSEIALQCGFVDQAHLSKHFRGIMGDPPGAWRRARRLTEPSNILVHPAGAGIRPTATNVAPYSSRS